MKRKLVEQGGTTLMVSLPSKWARRLNLKKGDEVEVEEEGDGLFIGAEKGYKLERIEVDVSNMGPFLTRYLAALYRKGYDEIEIKFGTPGLIKDIQGILKEYLIGFEIVKQGKNYCVIKNISKGIEDEFDTILKRIFLLLKSMADDCFKAIEESDYKLLDDVRHMEDTNNRFTTFCRRLLIKRGYNDQKIVPLLYNIIEWQEKIADEYKYLCDYILVSNKKLKISQEVLKLFQDVNNLLADLYELYYKFDINKVLEITKKRKNLIKEIHALFETNSPADIRVLHYLLNITQLAVNMVNVRLTMVV